MVTVVQDEEGVEHTDPKSIAEVFAKFYADLYARDVNCIDGSLPEETQNLVHATHFSMDELKAAMRTMKAYKSSDTRGVRAELLKEGQEELWTAVLMLFNDVLVGGKDPPAEWKKTRLIVLLKKGDPKIPALLGQQASKLPTDSSLAYFVQAL